MMTHSFSLVVEELKKIETSTPWFRVESTCEVVCPKYRLPYKGCKGLQVQLLLTGVDSHNSKNDDNKDAHGSTSVLFLLDVEMVLRVEILFFNPPDNEDDESPVNSFHILHVTPVSLPSPSPRFYDHNMSKSEIYEIQKRMISFDKEIVPPKDTRILDPAMTTCWDAHDILSQMTILRTCLHRRLPYLVVQACLLRNNIPIELRAQVVKYMNTVLFNDTSIRYAIRLWITNRDIAMSHLGHISTWNTSQVTSMKGLFQDKRDFNDDITGWDVRNVTNMMGMFANASSFNQPIDSWQLSNNVDVSYMFRGATGFNQTLPSWRAYIEEKCQRCNNMFDADTRWDILGGKHHVQPMYITVKPPNYDDTVYFLLSDAHGNMFPVTFKRSDSISTVIAFLSPVFNKPEDEIRLIKYGKILELYLYISEVDIQFKEVVKYVFRFNKMEANGSNIVFEESLLPIFCF